MECITAARGLTQSLCLGIQHTLDVCSTGDTHPAHQNSARRWTLVMVDGLLSLASCLQRSETPGQLQAGQKRMAFPLGWAKIWKAHEDISQGAQAYSQGDPAHAHMQVLQAGSIPSPCLPPGNSLDRGSWYSLLCKHSKYSRLSRAVCTLLRRSDHASRRARTHGRNGR